MPCEFCNNPDIEKRVVARDGYAMAFPSNMPVVPGHIIVCPVRHVEAVHEASERDVMAMLALAARLRPALQELFGATGFNYAWNEGKSAGQVVSHFHLHMIPRKEGDAPAYGRPGEGETVPEAELQSVAKAIRELL